MIAPTNDARWHGIGWLAFFTCALSLPVALEDYHLYRLTLAGVTAIAIVGLNLLIGLSGQFSIGHSAFFALGAYTAAIAMSDWGIDAYTAITLAALVGFAAGFLFGWPALRMGLVHLALTTWALALTVPQLLKSSHLEAWTGGVQGVYLDRPGAPFGLPLSKDEWWHLVVAAILALSIWLGRNLWQSRSGRALMAIRDNQIAAAPMGVNVSLYKTSIFGISAAFAAVAGAFWALLTDFVAPDSFSVFFSIMLVIGAVAGGVQSVWGAIFGGFFIQYLPDLARNVSGAVSFPAYGFILIALIYLMPKGLAGGVDRLRQRFFG